LPDFESRKKLWDRMLVEQIPLYEAREQIITECAELSEGFSGREIRTCMRLALPKAFLEASTDQVEPKLRLNYIKTSIAQIRMANKEVSSSSSNMRSARAELDTATKLLGIHPAINSTQQE
jgi:AAA+ superfamily predicted ATPase